MDESYRTLRKLKREWLLQELTHTITPKDLEAQESHRQTATDNKNKAKERQKRKFDTLNHERERACERDGQRITSSDRLVVNLSSKSLNDMQKFVSERTEVCSSAQVHPNEGNRHERGIWLEEFHRGTRSNREPTKKSQTPTEEHHTRGERHPDIEEQHRSDHLNC